MLVEREKLHGKVKHKTWTNTDAWIHTHAKSPCTFSLRASGDVHFTGSLAVSCVEDASFVRPKSLTLAMLSSDTRTFRAAKSLCTKLLASRYSMASHTSLGNGARERYEIE